MNPVALKDQPEMFTVTLTELETEVELECDCTWVEKAEPIQAYITAVIHIRDEHDNHGGVAAFRTT